MHALVCRKCGFPKGKHSVFSYNCPDGKQFSTQKFEPVIPRLTMDEHRAKALQKKPLSHVETEVATQVIKTIETILDCFTLDSKQYTKAELIDVLALVRKGYSK